MVSDDLSFVDGSVDHDQFPIADVLLALGWDGEVNTRRYSRNGWHQVRTCAFHHGDGGAAYNEELNSYRCFSCGAKGNSVSLVMQQRNLDRDQAVAWLIENIGKSNTRPTRAESDRLPWETEFWRM